MSAAALLAGLVADDPVELAHHPRVRVRAHHRAEAVVRVVSTVATQSRSASLTASFSVRLPLSHGLDLGAEQAHAEHVERLALRRRRRPCTPCTPARSARRRSRVATPCWPAPVSATSRVLPIRLASSAWPRTLLILCEPVWLRSSRLSSSRRPSSRAEVVALGEDRRPAGVVAQDVVELGAERRVGPRLAERRLQLLARRHERLGHEPPAELAEPPVADGSAQSALVGRHSSSQSYGSSSRPR